MSIIMVLGAPGAGKTTYLAILAHQYIKKNKNVYSNVYIKDTLMLEPAQDLNLYDVSGGLVLIDEGGTELDNRNWKNHSRRMIRWFKLHRHYGCNVYISSQDYDIDVKVRTLCKELQIVKPSIIPYFISVRRISIGIGINEEGSEIIQKYDPINMLFGGLKLYFAPKYWKYFDSYYKDKLLRKEWLRWCKENQDAYTYDFTNPKVRMEWK